MVRALCYHCQGLGFNPWSGNRDPTSHVAQPKNEKYKQQNTRAVIFKQCPVKFPFAEMSGGCLGKDTWGEKGRPSG